MTDLPRENVQDYPRPPALEPVSHRIVIRLGGAVAADTTAAFRVLETHSAPTYYLPPEDVHATLIPTVRTSFCEWKGKARYYDLVSGGKTAKQAVWSYDDPVEAFSPITGYLAFYVGLMDECRVGEVLATPQAGGFYGGWVTPNLDGRIKGEPGTEGW